MVNGHSKLRFDSIVFCLVSLDFINRTENENLSTLFEILQNCLSGATESTASKIDSTAFIIRGEWERSELTAR